MVEYTNRLDGISPKHLAGFFEGWPDPPDARAHLAILRGSYAVWLAVDDQRCVGFINAISDGVFYAHIPLLEVLPSHRGKGIGGELVRRMLDTLAPMYAVDIVCDEALAPFYKTFGLHPCTAMVKRNFAHQNAASRPRS